MYSCLHMLGILWMMRMLMLLLAVYFLNLFALRLLYFHYVYCLWTLSVWHYVCTRVSHWDISPHLDLHRSCRTPSMDSVFWAFGLRLGV